MTALWRISGGRRLTPAPFIIAGIVNLTPDSFSDGGSHIALHSAMRRVQSVVDEGALIVDLGPESTRPGAQDIGHQEEWARLEPVLARCLALRFAPAAKSTASPLPAPLASAALPTQASTAPPALPFYLSVDTFRAETAKAALTLHTSISPKAAPVDIINDISGGAFDPAMDDILACFKPGYVLCHSYARPAVMQNNPQYNDVVEELLRFFEKSMTRLVKAGLPEECVALDPGIGFGKTLDHTLAIFKNVHRFAALGRPLYFGISRKSFLERLIGLPLAARDPATAVATALLAQKGVAIHRVHDVRLAAEALALAAAMH